MANRPKRVGQAGPASGIPASGIPAHGRYKPAEPGNVLTLRHGARSPRVYGALAEQLAAGLVEDRPDLAAYPEAVAAWATAEAQAVLLRRHVEFVGAIDAESGRPRESALNWLTRLENAAANHRKVLGLDPTSEARLARDRATAAAIAVDLGAIAKRGEQVLAQRLAAGLPLGDDLAGATLDSVKRAAGE